MGRILLFPLLLQNGSPRALGFRTLVKGNEDSGKEIGQRGQDLTRSHVKRHLAMASAVFFIFMLLASWLG